MPRAVIGRIDRLWHALACCRDTDSYGLDRPARDRLRRGSAVHLGGRADLRFATVLRTPTGANSTARGVRGQNRRRLAHDLPRLRGRALTVSLHALRGRAADHPSLEPRAIHPTNRSPSLDACVCPARRPPMPRPTARESTLQDADRDSAWAALAVTCGGRRGRGAGGAARRSPQLDAGRPISRLYRDRVRRGSRSERRPRCGCPSCLREPRRRSGPCRGSCAPGSVADARWGVRSRAWRPRRHASATSHGTLRSSRTVRPG